MSPDDRFFSIVTITLNDLGGLRRTGASVEAQSLDDFEWIVIDGASTDGTVAELEGCLLPNLCYVSEKDRGLYHAMNKGLGRSRGRYVIFMNSGDCFSCPTVLESVKQRILAMGRTPDIVYGDALEQTTDSELLLKKARPIEWLNYGMHTHHQAMFYSREPLQSLGFDESFKVSADYDLTCKIYRKRGAWLAVDLPICIFSRGGLSEKKSQVGRSENWRVQRDVLRHPLGRRLLTRTAYFASFVVREKFQPFYDWLRFQHGPSTS
jgi:putative colanic acid biosynthesis glycosyltransferase